MKTAVAFCRFLGRIWKVMPLAFAHCVAFYQSAFGAFPQLLSADASVRAAAFKLIGVIGASGLAVLGRLVWDFLPQIEVPYVLDVIAPDWMQMLKAAPSWARVKL
jgi:hypothetical protein